MKIAHRCHFKLKVFIINLNENNSGKYTSEGQRLQETGLPNEELVASVGASV